MEEKCTKDLTREANTYFWSFSWRNISTSERRTAWTSGKGRTPHHKVNIGICTPGGFSQWFIYPDTSLNVTNAPAHHYTMLFWKYFCVFFSRRMSIITKALGWGVSVLNMQVGIQILPMLNISSWLIPHLTMCLSKPSSTQPQGLGSGSQGRGFFLRSGSRAFWIEGPKDLTWNVLIARHGGVSIFPESWALPQSYILRQGHVQMNLLHL